MVGIFRAFFFVMTCVYKAGSYVSDYMVLSMHETDTTILVNYVLEFDSSVTINRSIGK